MNEADSYDPYLANADLIGQQMIAEVEEDIPWLDVAARRAQFEFRITTNGATGPAIQRLPVPALARADVLEESLAPVLQWAGPFVVEVWIAPDSVPAVWVELGLTQGAEIADIKGADLKAVVVAALRALWDTSVTADFLGFELYKRARGELQVPTTGRNAQKNMLKGLYSRHLEKADEALSKDDRRAAAGFTTAAAGCLGVPRQAVLGLTATTKYPLNSRSRGPSRRSACHSRGPPTVARPIFSVRTTPAGRPDHPGGGPTRRRGACCVVRAAILHAATGWLPFPSLRSQTDRDPWLRYPGLSGWDGTYRERCIKDLAVDLPFAVSYGATYLVRVGVASSRDPAPSPQRARHRSACAARRFRQGNSRLGSR